MPPKIPKFLESLLSAFSGKKRGVSSSEEILEEPDDYGAMSSNNFEIDENDRTIGRYTFEDGRRSKFSPNAAGGNLNPLGNVTLFRESGDLNPRHASSSKFYEMVDADEEGFDDEVRGPRSVKTPPSDMTFPSSSRNVNSFGNNIFDTVENVVGSPNTLSSAISSLHSSASSAANSAGNNIAESLKKPIAKLISENPWANLFTSLGLWGASEMEGTSTADEVQKNLAYRFMMWMK